MRAPKSTIAQSRAYYDDVAGHINTVVLRRYSPFTRPVMRTVPRDVRADVAAIFGLMRLADEILDARHGPQSRGLLDELRRQVEHARWSGFSSNPVVHGFSRAMFKGGVSPACVAEMFEGLSLDTHVREFDSEQHAVYVRATGEFLILAVGAVLVNARRQSDEPVVELSPRATALGRIWGRALQRIIFLRDLSVDLGDLNRCYFPQLRGGNLTDEALHDIIATVRADMTRVRDGLDEWPPVALGSVCVGLRLYGELLDQISTISMAELVARVPRLHRHRYLRAQLLSRLGR